MSAFKQRSDLFALTQLRTASSLGFRCMLKLQCSPIIGSSNCGASPTTYLSSFPNSTLTLFRNRKQLPTKKIRFGELIRMDICFLDLVSDTASDNECVNNFLN
ncbi:hypothetical protein TNCT_149941 [Trichonephila clavata]|uniref:Uncharacterized protein n=1 Tax=Trichonephila clavata TaxID=2740835 RepID=A0A8X6L6Z0_TRICU|nr:hypothetical protein TNCT_149941 [Trichonephila clavata]